MFEGIMVLLLVLISVLKERLFKAIMMVVSKFKIDLIFVKDNGIRLVNFKIEKRRREIIYTKIKDM